MPYLFKLTQRLARSWVRAAIVVTGVACAGDAPQPLGVEAPALALAASAPASISISPSSAAGTLGQSAQFTASVRDARGREISGATVTWTSTDSTIVAITPSGFATGIGVGSVNLVASAGTVSAQAPVSVDGTPIASITLDPSSASGTVGQSARFTATLRDASGATLTGRRVLWTSSAPGVVRVDSAGLATAVAPGTASVIAYSGGITGAAATTVAGIATPVVERVVVNPSSASGAVGDAAQFSATAYDASGKEVTGQAVTWASTNTAVATVTSTGYATATGGGTAALVATIAGQSGTAAITVSGAVAGGTATHQTVSPSSATLVVGGTQQLTATVTDALGIVLDGLVTSWSSSNTAVATVSATGLVTATGVGTATVAATTLGITTTSVITVTAAPAGVPSTDWPNAPASYATITDQPFDLFTSLGWALASGSAGIAVDASAPASPVNVVQFTYPAGMPGGSAPGTVFHGLPAGSQHFYAGFWFKASAGWQGHNSNVNKLAFTFASGSGGNDYLCFYGTPGGPYELRVSLEFNGADTRFWLPPNVASVPVTVGTWHRVEWQMEYTSPWQASGVVRFWLDGTLVGDYRDVVFPADAFSEFQLSPTWGGMGDTKSRTDYMWFDHVLLKGY